MKRIVHFHTHQVPTTVIHYLRGRSVDGLLRVPIWTVSSEWVTISMKNRHQNA